MRTGGGVGTFDGPAGPFARSDCTHSTLDAARVPRAGTGGRSALRPRCGALPRVDPRCHLACHWVHRVRTARAGRELARSGPWCLVPPDRPRHRGSPLRPADPTVCPRSARPWCPRGHAGSGGERGSHPASGYGRQSAGLGNLHRDRWFGWQGGSDRPDRVGSGIDPRATLQGAGEQTSACSLPVEPLGGSQRPSMHR